jgi:glycosyltransferase involved in cell wall biosynthesis
MGDRSPKVNVGLPVLNGDQHIRVALDSLLSQDFEDFRLLISDNASEDGTADICAEYASRDQRILYQRLSSRLSAPENFNRVFSESTAPYFMWAAHDDRWAPQFIRKCYQALEQNPKAVLSFPQSVRMDPDGNCLKTIVESMDCEATRPGRRFRQVLRRLHSCNTFYGLYRRSALERTSLLRPVMAGDHVLLVELSFLGPFVKVPEALFFRRMTRIRERHAVRDRRRLLDWDPSSAKRELDYPYFRMMNEYLSVSWRSPVNWVERLFLTFYALAYCFASYGPKLWPEVKRWLYKNKS